MIMLNVIVIRSWCTEKEHVPVDSLFQNVSLRQYIKIVLHLIVVAAMP